MMMEADYTDIAILKGPVIRKKLNKTKIVYVDVNFQNASADDANKMEFLILQNYYCSSITISQQTSGSEYIPILENYVLMGDAHTERDSQSWFTVSVTQFNSHYVYGRNLRLSMFQPDSTWQKFEIQNIRAVCKAGKAITQSKPVENANGLNYNLFSIISSDWEALSQAALSQKNLVELPELNITLAEFRKNATKKAKKKDKKSSASQPANDDFGIALNYTKGAEADTL